MGSALGAISAKPIAMFCSRVISTVVVLLSVAACGRSQHAQAPSVPSPVVVPNATAAPSPALSTPKNVSSLPPQSAALALHRAAIVIDTHNDVTQRLVIEG